MVYVLPGHVSMPGIQMSRAGVEQPGCLQQPRRAIVRRDAVSAAKIYRAIVSSAAAARGETARIDDARRSAKVALIGLDRSIVAIDALIAEDDDARLEFMRKQACRLRRQVEARFPDARAFIRPGLDAVCGQDDQSNRGAL